MSRDSRFSRLEVARGNVVCAGGGELALAEGFRIMASASGPADVPAAAPSVAFVPDPSPGDASR